MWVSLPWLTRYMRLFPQVEQCLAQVAMEARQITHDLLRDQALLSLENKAFHCYGGAVMALLALPARRSEIISLIVYLQTISDYLDNLCDRAGSTNEEAFLLLHQALSDALDPQTSPGNYYARYGSSEDHYLHYLVGNCQHICSRLPSLAAVEQPLRQLITYYSYLQTYKHMPPAQREEHLQTYLQEQVPNPHGLTWWELAAATGSTLGMFALLAIASREELDEKETTAILEAYFPWICGLHILLDYLIDQEEDRQGGDLNFISFYSDAATAWDALRHFVSQAQQQANKLAVPSLHLLVVTGLLAMYMSDPKVRLQGVLSQAKTLMKSAGRSSLALFHLCRLTRRWKGVK